MHQQRTDPELGRQLAEIKAAIDAGKAHELGPFEQACIRDAHKVSECACEFVFQASRSMSGISWNELPAFASDLQLQQGRGSDGPEHTPLLH